jgi:hypothetical protein
MQINKPKDSAPFLLEISFLRDKYFYGHMNIFRNGWKLYLNRGGVQCTLFGRLAGDLLGLPLSSNG